VIKRRSGIEYSINPAVFKALRGLAYDDDDGRELRHLGVAWRRLADLFPGRQRIEDALLRAGESDVIAAAVWRW